MTLKNGNKELGTSATVLSGTHISFNVDPGRYALDKLNVYKVDKQGNVIPTSSDNDIKDNGINATGTEMYFLLKPDAGVVLDDLIELVLVSANDKENNIYLSAAYTNIAEILKESGSLNKAEDYFKLGLKTDFERSNYEGMYYICLKLSQLYETLAPQKVLAFLLKSLSSAKRTREALYITNAYIELGDYYMTKHQDAKAFKALLLAKKNISADESSESIDLRINDLKARMDKDLTDKITDEVNQHE